jgi:hypothetical protein
MKTLQQLLKFKHLHSLQIQTIIQTFQQFQNVIWIQIEIIKHCKK